MLKDVAVWLQQNLLKLNRSETETLYLGWGELVSGIRLPLLDGILLVLMQRAKSLGVILKPSRLAFFHLQQI